MRIDAARRGGSRRLLVDLTTAEFCDSTGLRALIGCRLEIVAGGGRMVVAALDDSAVGRMFALAGAHELLPVYEDAAGAGGARARADLSSAAVLLALGAAVMHAAWTLLLARAPDTDAATAAALAIAVVVFAPFAVLGWDVEAAALPYIALSAAFELGFFATLALALRSRRGRRRLPALARRRRRCWCSLVGVDRARASTRARRRRSASA